MIRAILLSISLFCVATLQAQSTAVEKLKAVYAQHAKMEVFSINIYSEIFLEGNGSQGKQLIGTVKKNKKEIYVKRGGVETLETAGKKIQIDKQSNHVVYYPDASKTVDPLNAEPDWKTIEKQSSSVTLKTLGKKTMISVPVNSMGIEKIEYTIGANNLLESLNYYYDQKDGDDIERIKVVYRYDQNLAASKAPFKLSSVIQLKNNIPHLTDKYQQFQLINASDYEKVH